MGQTRAGGVLESSMAGEEVGLPVNWRRPEMNENTLRGMGSSVTPSWCSRPFGARAFTTASHSNAWLD